MMMMRSIHTLQPHWDQPRPVLRSLPARQLRHQAEDVHHHAPDRPGLGHGPGHLPPYVHRQARLLQLQSPDERVKHPGQQSRGLHATRRPGLCRVRVVLRVSRLRHPVYHPRSSPVRHPLQEEGHPGQKTQAVTILVKL